MTTYKELADRLETFAANCCIPDDENTPPREAAAILRSLDAQPQQASKPLSDAEIFDLAEPFGAFEFGDSQGNKRLDFARAAITAFCQKNGIKERG